MALQIPAFWSPSTESRRLPAPGIEAADACVEEAADGACNIDPDDPGTELGSDLDDERVLRNAPAAQAPQSVKPWVLRPSASHLVQSSSGIYHLRLVIPERVRALHPGLPREFRRSTKTRVKRQALAHFKQIWAELVTSLVAQGHAMLVNQPTTFSPRRGFVIEVVDGTIRAELFPGTDPLQLNALMQVLPVLNDRLSVVATQSTQQAQVAQAPASANAAQSIEGAAPGSQPTVVSLASVPSAPHTPILPLAQATPLPVQTAPGPASYEPPPPSAAPPSPAPLPAAPVGASLPAEPSLGHDTAIVWLSEGIQQWLDHGPNRFTKQTWQDAYAPSFRVAREILANTRHDVSQQSGGIKPSMLDIKLADLTRERINYLRLQLEQYPTRQGARQDDVEAPERIRQAKALKLPVLLPGNVEKKLSHLAPFIKYARLKGWIAQEVEDEFKLALSSASTRASQAAKKSGIAKPGAVALLTKELREAFQCKLYRMGALQCDWKYWIPPMRLYTGGRVSEISQLQTSDIVQVDGVSCISFVEDAPSDTAPEDTDDESECNGLLSTAQTLEEYRRLKNAASRRIIPVHPRLVELGFVEWVEQRRQQVGEKDELLFEGLTWEPKSGYGRKPAKHTIELLKAAGIWQKRRKVGHSLRANCTQELMRVGMPLPQVQRYLGHSTRTELEASYLESDQGPAYPMRVALEYLAKTDFGVKLPTFSEIEQQRREADLRKAPKRPANG